MKAEGSSARWNEGCLPPSAHLQPFVPLWQHRKAISVLRLQRVMRQSHHHVLGTQTVGVEKQLHIQRALCHKLVRHHSLEFENLADEKIANDSILNFNARRLISDQKQGKKMEAKRKETQ